MMKKLAACLCAAAFAVSVTGCGSSNQSGEQAQQQEATTAAENQGLTITDAIGRRVELKAQPQRIVVTSASFLEPLEALGGADRVVGRPDSHNQMPDYAKKLTSVGKVYQIDLEKVVACQPDLVILNKGMNEKLIDQLTDAGIPCIVLDMKSYNDVKQEVEIMGQLTGQSDKATELMQSMDQKIDDVKSKLPVQQSCRVAIIHSTSQGLSVQLDGSIAGSIAKMLGWDNVASHDTPLANDPDTAPYSLETLADENPEFIFVTSMGDPDELKANMEQTMQSDPAWSTISAVRDGHVYYLPQNLFLLSPGIHYPEAVETMAKCIYPGVFEK